MKGKKLRSVTISEPAKLTARHQTAYLQGASPELIVTQRQATSLAKNPKPAAHHSFPVREARRVAGRSGGLRSGIFRLAFLSHVSATPKRPLLTLLTLQLFAGKIYSC